MNNEVTKGAVKDAVGGKLFTTEIETELEVAVKPRSSVATAVITWLPKVEVYVAAYGETKSVPTGAPSTKN